MATGNSPIYKAKLLEYLGNPQNEWPQNRIDYARIILNKAIKSLYDNFTPDELTEIEQEALQIRRQRYSPKLSQVDRRMLNSAAKGDTKAAKLIYERIEGLPTQKIDLGQSKDEPLSINITLNRS